MENNTNEFDFNPIFRKTDKRIAEWHNSVPDMPEYERNVSLQVLVKIIIEDAIKEVGSSFGIPLKTEIPMSKELRQKIDEIKRSEGFTTGDGNMKKIFDSDSFLED